VPTVSRSHVFDAPFIYQMGTAPGWALNIAQPQIYQSPSSSSDMNYSIEGLGLKLNTREDIEPYLNQIEPNISHLEEIHLCGNTIGVGAAQALAEVLKKASGLRVRLVFMSFYHLTPTFELA
jgi:hypothetical protein